LDCTRTTRSTTTRKWRSVFATALNTKKAVAYGEIGLDFHYNRSPPDKQREVFRKQLAIAVELKLPVVVHSRDAAADTFDILTASVPRDWKIHMHCFGDSSAQAEKRSANFPICLLGSRAR